MNRVISAVITVATAATATIAVAAAITPAMAAPHPAHSRPASHAKLTVHAIGLNSRPSTRSSVKIGAYAVMMIAIE